MDPPILEERAIELAPLLESAELNHASLPKLSPLYLRAGNGTICEPIPKADIRQVLSSADFPLTVQNARNYFNGAPVQDALIDEYDFVLVFPSIKFMLNGAEGAIDPPEPEKEMSVMDCQNLLFKCFPFRGDNVDSLPDIYGLDVSSLKPMTKSELTKLVYTITTRTLGNCGVHHTAFKSTIDDQIILKMRLSEPALKRLARDSKYSLQVDPEVIPEVYRTLDYFSAPTTAYEDAEGEDDKDGIVSTWRAYQDHGRVWMRYDTLGREMKMKGFDPKSPELSIFRDIDRKRMLDRLTTQFFHFPQMMKHGFVNDELYLHQYDNLKPLTEQWLGWSKLLSWNQPIQFIRNYYGEEWAFYFYWMGFYVKLLVIPVVLGIVTAIYERIMDRDSTYEVHSVHIVSGFYSIIVMVWCTIFIELWRRAEIYHSYLWGVDDADSVASKRREFKPDHYRVDEITPTAPLVPSYTTWKSFLRRSFTFGVAVVFLGFVIFTMLTVMGFQLHVHHHPELYGDFVSKHYETLGGMCISVAVFLFERIWRALAGALTRFENIKYDHAYRRSLTLKLFVFAFINDFSALFYVAFIKERVEEEGCPTKGCMMSLRINLRSLLMVYFFLNFAESGLPWLIHKCKRCKKDLSNENVTEFQLELVSLSSFKSIASLSHRTVHLSLPRAEAHQKPF
eukprot:GHVN01066527.1.p1 GENE.GHVN01066527.1~~GHVN01066527.1.p1  ORF type:complete len:676 (+),score=60.22 GHVN01066527.1:2760-4787(+)